MTIFTSILSRVSSFFGFSLIALLPTALLSENTFYQASDVIEFNESSYENYLSKEDRLVLKSKQGLLNLNNNEINLFDDIEGEITLDGESYNLKAEILSGNLFDKYIYSNKKVLFEAKGFEISSSSMKIIQSSQEKAKIIFWDANLIKINQKSKMRKGKAYKIELSPSKDLILLEGNVEFYEDNMKIISDEIHYDLGKDRILKSLNAKITNNI
ncbi:MAG: hypothetical protein CMG62_10450 [Candidatus Marinimicrobia bacterium]|nr:hypothetical protein [Candidatus Neomarinimicrobiota bacterium]